MQRSTRKLPDHAVIDSLETLQLYKEQLRNELCSSEERLGDLWESMFRQPTAEDMSSPTKRLMAKVSSASALIDGAILGWKLYCRLGGTLRLFKRKKKK